MKAKKLMGLIAFASACVSLSALANTTNGWFGVTVANSEVSTTNISKNAVGDVGVNAINLAEVEQETPLVFTPNADFEGTNRNDGIYVISASVALTPCSIADFPSEVTNGKAGIAVGIDSNDVTNYYGYANDAWNKLDGATVVESGNATDFSIVLNYRDGKVYFFVDDKCFDYSMGTTSATALESIKAWGTGSISSVTGAFEVAEAAYDGKKYGSVAEAMTAANEYAEAHSTTVNYNEIGVIAADGKEESKTADLNGLMPWQNKAMGVEPNEQVGLAKASTKQNSGKITLAAVLPNEEAGVEVKFYVWKDGVEHSGPFAEDDIQIPMTSGTYTIVPVVQSK